MLFSSWLRNWKRSIERRSALHHTLLGKPSARRWAPRPRLEVLEDRLAPAVLTVNTTTDSTAASNDLTLREAILLVNNAGNAQAALGRNLTTGEAEQISGAFGVNDTIAFDNTVFAMRQTITLGGTELPVLTQNMTLTSPSVGVTISGADLSRVFDLGDGSHNPSVTISNLTVTQGYAGGNSFPSSYGGGILDRSGGTVTLSNCTLTGNTAGEGGGFYGNGAAVLSNCTISDNTAHNGAGLTLHHPTW